MKEKYFYNMTLYLNLMHTEQNFIDKTQKHVEFN